MNRVPGVVNVLAEVNHPSYLLSLFAPFSFLCCDCYTKRQFLIVFPSLATNSAQKAKEV